MSMADDLYQKIQNSIQNGIKINPKSNLDQPEYRQLTVAEQKPTIQAEPKLGVVEGEMWRFKDENGKIWTISMLHKKFADNYLLYDGDRIEAMMNTKGYNPKNARVASQMAYALLRRVDITAYINSKLAKEGYNDDNVRKQHLWLINQQFNLSAKSRALDMYFKVKGKYPQNEDNKNNIPAVGVFSLSDLAEKAKEIKTKKAEIIDVK